MEANSCRYEIRPLRISLRAGDPHSLLAIFVSVVENGDMSAPVTGVIPKKGGNAPDMVKSGMSKGGPKGRPVVPIGPRSLSIQGRFTLDRNILTCFRRLQDRRELLISL